MDSYGCLRQSHSREPDRAVAVILVHAGTQMLFQAGSMLKCIYSACYCCFFLGLGSFKVLCGKEVQKWKENVEMSGLFPCFSMQGLMFGYATDETEECMPLTLLLAHKLTASIKALERNGTWPWVRPDGKTQVRNIVV